MAALVQGEATQLNVNELVTRGDSVDGRSGFPKHAAVDSWGEMLKGHLSPAEHKHLGASLHEAIENESPNFDLGETNVDVISNFARAVVDLDKKRHSNAERKRLLQRLFDGLLAMLKAKVADKSVTAQDTNACNAKSTSSACKCKGVVWRKCQDYHPFIVKTSNFVKKKGLPTSCRLMKKQKYCDLAHQVRKGGWNGGKNLYGFDVGNGSKSGSPFGFLTQSDHVSPGFLEKLKVASDVARLCPATCGFCKSPCVQQCEKIIRGACKGRECGCDWVCPNWAHATVKCGRLGHALAQNECAKLCHNAHEPRQSVFHTSQGVVTHAVKQKDLHLELFAMKREEFARFVVISKETKIVTFGETMKIVNCLLDKKNKVRCMVKKIANVKLACITGRRFQTRTNPYGLTWRGRYSNKRASKQPWCCKQEAKTCGKNWINQFTLGFKSEKTGGKPKYEFLKTPRGLTSLLRMVTATF